MIGGLLEGAAFLAARVQLKLKHEFPEFTSNLLEQLVPHYLAPTPSAMIVQGGPDLRRQGAARGSPRFPRGSYLDATYRERDRQIACRYRLCSDIIALAVRTYRRRIFLLARAAAGARRCRSGSEVLAGLRLSLDASNGGAPRRTRRRDAEALKKPDMLFAGCRTTDLPLYFARLRSGFDRALRAAVRPLQGRLFPLSRRVRRSRRRSAAAADASSRSASSTRTRLFPNDTRVFEGFDLLREFFVFPRKFLGCELTGSTASCRS